jgi:hypothetical protein
MLTLLWHYSMTLLSNTKSDIKRLFSFLINLIIILVYSYLLLFLSFLFEIVPRYSWYIMLLFILAFETRICSLGNRITGYRGSVGKNYTKKIFRNLVGYFTIGLDIPFYIISRIILKRKARLIDYIAN